LSDVCPTHLAHESVVYILVCCKCYAQISKSQWHSWVSSNDILPDDIPRELARLTADEVRTISLICPVLKVLVLPGGQFGKEGSVIHFPFPVQHVDEPIG